MELLMSSNGIMDMIKLYRGESKLRAPLAKGFAENSGKYYTPQKSFARHIAQGGSMSQGNLIGDLKGKVKSLKIPLSKYKELGGNSLQVILDDPKLLNAAKTDVMQTVLARAGSLTPLAMKGLSFLASLPAQAILMTLSPTKMGNGELNIEDANSKLEQLAKKDEKSNVNVDKPLYDYD